MMLGRACRLTGQRRRYAVLAVAPLVVAATAAIGSGAGPTSAAAVLGQERATVPVEVFLDEGWGDDSTHEDEKASKETGRWKAKDDLGSLFNAHKWYGVHKAWGKSDHHKQKVTGRGVDVALIDTGVAPVAGLTGPEKVVNGPDLSFESQNDNTRYLDGYGHGTHMAGIIAGRDTDVERGKEDDDEAFVGMAPDARIVNLKVATADGGADVSQVIAAIDWVVQHRQEGGLNIRVINLSYGTHSSQPYTVDPLAFAVENAWRKGIVVVAAAGNDGAGHQLTMPAADPHVLAVGAVDHAGTSARGDDVTGSFTNSGTPERRPDLLAPGKSVVSLRTPGSYSDRAHPEGLVNGDETDRFFRGSGTSQATATVSGAAALLLQQRPELTPDQVKYLLTSTADTLKEGGPSQGAGVLDVDDALKAKTPAASDAVQSWPSSTGTGSLEASRGGSHVVDPLDGTVLTGEVDAMGARWVARSWRDLTTADRAWSEGAWNGRRWTGSGWTGESWTARSWREATWSGASWTGGDWSARSWRGDQWTADGWSSITMSARSWSEVAWNSRSWRDYWGNASPVW